MSAASLQSPQCWQFPDRDPPELRRCEGVFGCLFPSSFLFVRRRFSRFRYGRATVPLPALRGSPYVAVAAALFCGSIHDSASVSSVAIRTCFVRPSISNKLAD